MDYEVQKNAGYWRLKKVGGERATIRTTSRQTMFKKIEEIVTSGKNSVVIYSPDGHVKSVIVHAVAIVGVGSQRVEYRGLKVGHRMVAGAPASRFKIFNVGDVMPPPKNPRKKK
jgi:hypothetical protein